MNELSLSEKMKLRQKERAEMDLKARQLAGIRASMAMQKEEVKRKALEDERARKERLLEEKRFLEEERIRIETEKKTKKYFQFNLYERKVPPPGEPYYFGEHTAKGKKYESWLPHGQGQLYINDLVKMEGQYDMGLLHGTGTVHFDDGWIYHGEFKKGLRHGIGIMSKKEEIINHEDDGDRHHNNKNKKSSVTQFKEIIRHVIVRRNEIICFRDGMADMINQPTLHLLTSSTSFDIPHAKICYLELLFGAQIEIEDKLFQSFPTYTPTIRAVIVKHVRDWRFVIRFTEVDIQPREREMDVSTFHRCEVLHHLPKIYNLSGFDITIDHRLPYHYEKDTFRDGVSNLRIAGGRHTYDMKTHNSNPLSPRSRIKSDHQENLFEPRAIGLGLAKEDEEADKLKELKRKQFEELIAKKREEEEKIRKERIEEEQKKQMAEAMEKQKEQTAAKKKEKEDFDKMMQERLMQENAAWDVKAANEKF